MTTAALGPERVEQFAFVEFPDSPVTAVGGTAQVAGNQMRSPRIDVQNRSGKAVKYVELGWLVRDESGQQYMAAAYVALRGVHHWRAAALQALCARLFKDAHAHGRGGPRQALRVEQRV